MGIVRSVNKILRVCRRNVWLIVACIVIGYYLTQSSIFTTNMIEGLDPNAINAFMKNRGDVKDLPSLVKSTDEYMEKLNGKEDKIKTMESKNKEKLRGENLLAEMKMKI